MKFIPWNPLAINGARNILAAFIIGAYLLIKKHPIRINKTVILGALCMFGVTTMFTIANKMTTAGNAIILQYTAPIWIIVLLFFYNHRKPTKLELITMGFVFIGILCFFGDSLSSGHIVGDLVAILSGVFYAGLFMLNDFEGGDVLSSMFIGQLVCGIVLTPLVFRETDFGSNVILSLVFLGVVQLGLAYILFSEGIKYTSSVTASLIAGIEPVLNPLIVAVIFGEMLKPLALVGATIVILAVIIYNIRAK